MIDLEAAKQKLLDDKKRWADLFEKHHNEDMLDEDGYPTETALMLIEKWHWTDSKGWFEFIKSIWHLASWGWHEGEEPHDWDATQKVYRYNVSTAGWSGNEAIVRSMQANEWMWHFNWVQSRRGGHYIFELKNFKDE
jgi:hypothetical protein